MWNAVLIGARLLQFASASTLFGAPLFYLYRAGRPVSPDSRRRPWPPSRPLLLGATALTGLGALLWIMAETASISGEAGDALRVPAVWTVLADTRFGRACLVRLLLLGLAGLVIPLRLQPRLQAWLQSLLGALIVGSFAWTGHGASGHGIAAAGHLTADLLHLWMAALWLGALAALTGLAITAAGTPATAAAHDLRDGLMRFSPLGTAVVALLVLSGVVNACFLIGASRWRTLFTSAYGLALLLKLLLLLAMLALAARHRFILTPALQSQLRESSGVPHDEPHGEPDVRTALLNTLRASLMAETALALAVLLVVSFMGTWEPPAAAP